MQIARGSGATLSECTFFEKCASPKDFTEHLMASLTKAVGLHLFLLGKTRRNKKAFEFNHDTLGGLTNQGPRGSPR